MVSCQISHSVLCTCCFKISVRSAGSIGRSASPRGVFKVNQKQSDILLSVFIFACVCVSIAMCLNDMSMHRYVVNGNKT